MNEIVAIPWNGFNVVSTFSGCGGSCLGYRMAGFRVLWASEFVAAAQRNYRQNHPETILDDRDIRKVESSEIVVATRLQAREIDILDGSPPCQSFSTAGTRDKNWGKVVAHGDGSLQRSDDLFFEYARLVRELQPKTFVAENVSGLIKGRAKGYFLLILKHLRNCGYRVMCRVLDAQWLGVPQMRERAIFIGVREDLKLDPIFPKPLPFRYSVKDALPWITQINRKGGHYVASDSQPSPSILSSDAHRKESAQLSAAGWCRDDKGDARKFTIDELKRICGFPDDFVLVGSHSDQWARLGNAVPPPMMQRIAEIVRDKILRRA